jgi:hypothetical protein
MRSSDAARLGPVERDAGRDDRDDDDEDRLIDDDELDADPLLPESELLIERLQNELEGELAGADAYERGFLICNMPRLWLMAAGRPKQDCEQGDPGHWNGQVPVAALHTLRLWLVCGQVSKSLDRDPLVYLTATQSMATSTHLSIFFALRD